MVVGWMQRKQFWLPAQGEVFLLDIPLYKTSESRTIWTEQLPEVIRKLADPICRPWYEGIKSWASCHRRECNQRR
jgi:hypothetical protein